MKNEVKKVDKLTEEDKKTYSLTKSEAFQRLIKEGITESEQVFTKWCRDAEIDAVRVSKGHPKERGIHVSEASLTAFIHKKKGNVEDLIARIQKLETENKALKAELKELKANGIQKPKKTVLEDPVLSFDGAELTFRHSRAMHRATFDDRGQIVEITRNGRGRQTIPATELISEKVKKSIVQTRQELLQKQS